MPIPASPALMPYAMAAGLGWLYYRRIRKHIGRQQWQPRRTLVRMALLSLVVACLLLAGVFVPGARYAVGIGLITGVGAGVFGLSLTRIEHDERGRWYTPNPWIGGALAILLIARLGWRMLHVGIVTQQGGQVQASPLTLGIAATLVGYYLAYSFLLMRRMREAGSEPG